MSHGHFRAHPRLEVALPAALQEPSTGATESIRILNLSLAGACVETKRSLPLGASVTLEVAAPTLWDPLVLRARVAWSSSFRGATGLAGICFEHDNAARAFALFELLQAPDEEAG